MNRNEMDLNLLKEEYILERFHGMQNPSVKWIYFPTLWFVVSFILLLGVIVSFLVVDSFIFYTCWIILIGFNIYWGYFYDFILRASDASLIITDKRLIYFYGKGLLRYKKKRKVIYIGDISYIQSWPNSVEIVKKRSKGDRYNGTEKKFKYLPMNYYSIHLNLNGPGGDESMEKLIQTLSGLISFSKHPNLNGILLHK